MLNEHDSSWGLDEEIRRMEELVRHWQAQVDLYEQTASGALIKSIARGYALQLDALRRASADH